MAMYSVKVQARFLDAIKDKANDPNSYDPRDEDAIADMEELLKNKIECCEVLEKILSFLLCSVLISCLDLSHSICSSVISCVGLRCSRASPWIWKR